MLGGAMKLEVSMTSVVEHGFCKTFSLFARDFRQCKMNLTRFGEAGLAVKVKLV